MKLTTRGWIVVYSVAIIGGFAIGMATANYCWYGYCGP